MITEPVHYDLLTAQATSSAGSGSYAAYRFRIICQQCSISNVTITRAINSLRITGYYHKTHSSGQQIRIFPDGVTIQNGKVYTFIAKGTIQTPHSVKRLYTDSFSSRDVYYQSNDTLIFYPTGGGIKDVGIFADMSETQDGEYFDFTITGLYLYEGAYLNPPLVNSLDVKPDEGDIFLHKDGINAQRFWIGTFSPPSNYFCTFLRFGSVMNKIYYGEFLLIKSWNTSSCQILKIQFSVGKSSISGTSSYKANLKVSSFSLGSAVSPTAYIKKIHILHDSLNNGYIGATFAGGQGSNQWYLSPLGCFFSVGGGAGYPVPVSQNNFGIVCVDANISNYTVITEVAPTEGF